MPKDIIRRTDKTDIAITVIAEWEKARTVYEPMCTPHHGHSVIMEEFEELWDEIKKYPRTTDWAQMRHEAIQLAAMAMAFVAEVVDRHDDQIS